MHTPSKSAERRRRLQLFLFPVMVVTVALGWKYPILGFSVPLVMVMGMVGGLFNGRYVCGNLCPRGAFFDRIMASLNPGKTVPAAFKNMPVRTVLLVGLMGFMGYRLAQDIGNWRHWGYTFWLMCAATSAVGVILGFLVQPRAWCAFCPMGTMQHAFGGKLRQVAIDRAACIDCRRCEKVCPISVPVLNYKAAGRVSDRDCLKCGECIAACPRGALSWQGGQKGSSAA
ncbi:MAG: 4Fe-4S dicluster domain-containing protein [Candidatus Omnitrophica bacterium]|nr:4Fe-4S dicluster domain-containing protein [Candidatus Omnitrophota bacterium]